MSVWSMADAAASDEMSQKSAVLSLYKVNRVVRRSKCTKVVRRYECTVTEE